MPEASSFFAAKWSSRASFGPDERVLPERHVLLATTELIPPKPELRACRQDEQTEAASVEHLVLLAFGFVLSISLMVSAMMSLRNGEISFPKLWFIVPQTVPPQNWWLQTHAFARPRTLFSLKLF
jgi:hypothetical protein